MELFIKQTPFFRLFLFTALGIIAAAEINFPAVGLITLSVVLLTALIVVYWLQNTVKQDIAWGVLFNALCIVTGLFLAQNFTTSASTAELKGDNNFTVRVEKYESQVKRYSRYLARLYIADTVTFFDQNVKIRLLVDTSEQRFQEGDLVFCVGKVQSIENMGNPGEFDYKSWANRKRIYYSAVIPKGNCSIIGQVEPFFVKRWLNDIRFWIEERYSQNDIIGRRGAVLTALTLGDKSVLDPEIKSSFAAAGLMHVLAVSGLHVGIIYLILSTLVAPLFYNRYGKGLKIFIVIVTLWLYAFFTGMSPSVSRAVLMFSFLVVGEVAGRKYSGLNALFASAFFLTLFDPVSIYDTGFQLSHLAVLGIFLFYRPVNNIFAFRHMFMNKIWSLAALSIAAQLATTPISLYYFNQFPTYFLLSNQVVVPLIGFIIQGTVVLLTFGFSPPLERIVAWCINHLLSIVVNFTEWLVTLPFSRIMVFSYDLFLLLGSYLVIFLIYRTLKTHSPKLLITASAIVAALLIRVVVNDYNQSLVSDIHVFKAADAPVYLVESDYLHALVADSATAVQAHHAQLSRYYGTPLTLVSYSHYPDRVSVWEHSAGRILIAPQYLLNSADSLLWTDFDAVVATRSFRALR